MKQVKIDLAEPFEEIVAKMRSIPPTDNFIDGKNTVAFELSSEMAEVLRSLYEAARGRQLATQIGSVPVGPPPIAPFLKDASFKVASQADFLLQALAKLYSGSCSGSGIRWRGINGEINNPRAEFQANRSFRRQQTGLSHAIK